MLRIGLALAVASLLPAQSGTPTAASDWISLFDGKTLAGWRQLNGTATYAVVDGAIVGTTSKGSPNSFLCSEQFFGDFELELEVKLLDDELNSGIQIRSHSYPTYQDRRVHGYQVEVSTNGEAGFVYDEARRGWLTHDRDDPRARAAFQNGAWNRYRIVCVGPVIRTWINDVPIADLRDDWSPAGFIGLQVHSVAGDPNWRVAWRNLRIRAVGDGGGFASIFDGKSLAGWRVNENPASVQVHDGALVVKGERAHVFYDGPVYSHSFQNFELSCLVRTKPGANSGVYFHTGFQGDGWPAKGYEVQVNNTQSDWRRTGGLYAVQDVKEAPAKDDQWFLLNVRVDGKHVVVTVDGKVTADYVEPDGVRREGGLEGRLLSRGTFALQCHDPGSEVHYKQIRVRPLPETMAAAK
ncbi:MAG: DUF1080 domain-containing protein [Planctomycetes bacterium]|nr:DUF1080 domain-containing protein [Planctomycetota bacterium]